MNFWINYQKITEQNKKLIEKKRNAGKRTIIAEKTKFRNGRAAVQNNHPLEVERRQNNLELHGLAEANGENAVKSVLSKVSPEPVTIVKCFRYGKKETPTGEKRTRPIFVQFLKKDERDKMYNNRSNLRKLQNRIYLNENLPKFLNELRGKANARRKQYKYKFIWTKNGDILVRKDENSKVLNIRTPSDLEKII